MPSRRLSSVHDNNTMTHCTSLQRRATRLLGPALVAGIGVTTEWMGAQASRSAATAINGTAGIGIGYVWQ